MKRVVAEVLPSLEGDEGADEPESDYILAFFGGARAVSDDEGGYNQHHCQCLDLPYPELHYHH